MAPIGMENPNNLCYMISVMQALFSIEQINGYISRKYSWAYLRIFMEGGNNTKKKYFHLLYHKFIQQSLDIAENQAHKNSKKNTLSIK